VCSTIGFEYCCLISWDKDCANLAIDLTSFCGAPASGSCLAVHERPYCSDQDCCDDVCLLDPSCCSISWDIRCVDWATRVCFTCGSPTAGSCCHQQANPHCSDRNCCEAICLTDAFCCDSRWDSLCAQMATQICGPCQRVCGFIDPANPNARLCSIVHTQPGCSDAFCCDNVCFFDPTCCVSRWDFACVEAAIATCALSPDPNINLICSNATGSCIITHATPGCSDPCCGQVCTLDPLCCEADGGGWDLDCVTAAEELCTDCGDIRAGSCSYPHGTPGCIDRECCIAVCAVDPPCCTAEWDVFCVAGTNTICVPQDLLITCGDPRTRPCAVSNYLPACSDARCCDAICLFDETCCTRAWDATCAAATRFACVEDVPNNCPGAGSPLVVHATPECSDTACCTAVCSLDPLCCTFGWNERCVSLAAAICWSYGGCPGEEPCDSAHASPGCSDPVCCSIVCFSDPLCCDVQWNSTCVTLARNNCANGEPDWRCPCQGSCFDVHETPGCSDEVCCNGVCNEDPRCCEEGLGGWDARCVALARAICTTFPDYGCADTLAGGCFLPHAQPFCNDPACCRAVCSFDPFCCDTRWDSSCVFKAQETCLTFYVGDLNRPHPAVGGCGFVVSGSCYSRHDWPGCSDGDCCVRVCEVDPLCCDRDWDDLCVGQARGIPDGETNGPLAGICSGVTPPAGGYIPLLCATPTGARGCNIPHPPGGCADRECCKRVCTLDPFCCDVAWDQDCVSKIFNVAECSRYQFGCGDGCSGSCCEPHGTPWCRDPTCCNTVCNLDSFCCTTQWDAACAAAARTLPQCDAACPLPECGDPDAGSCCQTHPTPSCSDFACCDSVCTADPFCCDLEWDGVCVNLAVANCGNLCDNGVACGDPNAGSCCNEHPTPYCNELKCCDAVCTLLPDCCFTAWDTPCVQFAQVLCGCP